MLWHISPPSGQADKLVRRGRKGLRSALSGCLLILLAGSPAGAQPPAARFDGRVVVEWLDELPAKPRLRLEEDFAFIDGDGRRWVAKKGLETAGERLPRVFRRVFGAPLDGRYRRAALVHEAYSQYRRTPWPETHRMLYAALLASGADEIEAKQRYLAVFAEAERWEVEGGSCFSHCHAADSQLTWRPEVREDDLQPIFDWIEESNPELADIEARAGRVILRPGPHLFVQGHPKTRTR